MVSEARVQQNIRLAAAQRNAALWRNNNGACRDETNRLIRYGLGNDSKKLNDVWKSSDLIGLTPVQIEPHHVGRTFGVFTACEVKHSDWKWTGATRETAQHAFLIDVARLGGIALFATDESQYTQEIERWVRGNE